MMQDEGYLSLHSMPGKP
jgi:hypothetical protein